MRVPFFTFLGIKCFSPAQTILDKPSHYKLEKTKRGLVMDKMNLFDSNDKSSNAETKVSQSQPKHRKSRKINLDDILPDDGFPPEDGLFLTLSNTDISFV